MPSGVYRESASTDEYAEQLQELLEAVAEKTGWEIGDFEIEILQKEQPDEKDWYWFVISRKSHKLQGIDGFDVSSAFLNLQMRMSASSRAELRKVFGEPYLVKEFRGHSSLEHQLNVHYGYGYKPINILNSGDHASGMIVFETR